MPWSPDTLETQGTSQPQDPWVQTGEEGQGLRLCYDTALEMERWVPEFHRPSGTAACCW